VPIEEKIRLVMEAVGTETVAYLKGLTQEQRGWATITGELAAGYAFEVTQVDGGARLTLRNDVDYAIYLEAKHGFFVLSGVLDPGGPVEQALVEVCARIAPEFQVVRSR
jgi:hypothetical protein